jgi:serine/threonine protein phosphatase 1
MLEHLEKEEGLSQSDVVIFVGDYIDRGPSSRGVVDLLLEFKVRFPKTRYLKGNHEDMLLDFLGFGGRMGEAFLYNGGLETIQSYGISVFASPEQMVKAFPSDHFQFYNSLESIIRVKDFLLVHAGLNPLRAINAQNDADIFWIRDDFIHNPHPYGLTIIFGHTPHHELLLDLPYKIGIDTGLVFGNKLTCLELFSGKVFQLARNSKDIAVGILPDSAS